MAFVFCFKENSDKMLKFKMQLKGKSSGPIEQLILIFNCLKMSVSAGKN